MKKICFISTTPKTLQWFMKPYIVSLSKKTSLTVLTQNISYLKNEFNNIDIQYQEIKISRKPSFLNDILLLLYLIKIFRKYKFNSVHSIMPKSGFLSMLAARFINIPNRFHTFTGQVWINKKGISRYFLRNVDKFICSLSTHVFADSHSQKEYLINNKIVSKKKIDVLLNGSICGVDIDKFIPNQEKKNQDRIDNKFSINSFIFLFLGRLNEDKGIHDLVKAFLLKFTYYKDCFLIFVGDDEINFKKYINTLKYNKNNNIRLFPYSNNPETFIGMSDIICLPSYREGFGSVIIEAAASGVPSIVSDIYGLKDSIIEYETGLKFPKGNIEDLSNAMLEMYTNKRLRKKFSKNARIRSVNLFNQKKLISAFEDFYKSKHLI